MKELIIQDREGNLFSADLLDEEPRCGRICVVITDNKHFPGEFQISRIAWVWTGDVVLGFAEPMKAIWHQNLDVVSTSLGRLIFVSPDQSISLQERETVVCRVWLIPGVGRNARPHIHIREVVGEPVYDDERLEDV